MGDDGRSIAILEPGRPEELIGNRGYPRHAGNLHPGLCGRVNGFDGLGHRLADDLLNLCGGQAFFDGDLTGLDLQAGFDNRVFDPLLDLVLARHVGQVADNLKYFLLVGHVHEREQERHRRLLIPLRHTLERLGHCGQLLRAEGRRARHVLQGDFQLGALHVVVEQLDAGILVDYRNVQGYLALVPGDGLRDVHPLVRLGILDDERQEQVADLHPGRLEIIEDVGDRLHRLLDERIDRNTRRCSVLRATLERAGHAGHPLDAFARVLQAVELLPVQLEVPLDVEPRARLRGCGRVKDDVRVGPADHLPELLVVLHDNAVGADRRAGRE